MAMWLKPDTSRLKLLDGIRGLLIIAVIVYHLLFDLVYIFGIDIDWYNSLGAEIWQEIMCCGFIVIAGICSAFTANTVKRALKLLFFAVCLSAVTYFVMPAYAVKFGILHCIGVCALIDIPLNHMLNKLKLPTTFFVFLSIGSAILFVLTFPVWQGFLGIPKYYITLPDILYSSKLFFWLGFPGEGFRSGDYFPLLPYWFMYLTGYSLSRIGIRSGFPRFMKISLGKALEFLGKNSLWLYLAHQPLIYICLKIFL